MNEEQFKILQDKLNTIINLLGDQNTRSQSSELKERGILNGLLHICTHNEFSDKEYCDALRQLSQFPFGLSSKQMAWILVYCNRHPQCGEQIQLFIKRQFEKAKDKSEYIKQIASVLRSKYSNDNNYDFIEKLIARISQI